MRFPRPIALALWCFATPAMADPAGDFSLSGSFRARYEHLEGQPRAGFDRDDDMLALRTIVAARYDLGSVQLNAEMWDSRAYLSDRGSPISGNEVNALELVQAYVEAELGAGARVQAGRIALNLGSRRFVAADDYRNTTNSFTGLRFDIGDPNRANATVIAFLPRYVCRRTAMRCWTIASRLIGRISTPSCLGPWWRCRRRC